jgi:hypothetical protein
MPSNGQIRYAACIRSHMNPAQRAVAECEGPAFYNWSKEKMSTFITDWKQILNNLTCWSDFPKSAMKQIAEDYRNSQLKDSYARKLPLIVNAASVQVEDVPSVKIDAKPKVLPDPKQQIEDWLKKVYACAKSMAFPDDFIKDITSTDNFALDNLVECMALIAGDLGATEEQEVSFMKNPEELQRWFENNYRQIAVNMGITNTHWLYLSDMKPEEIKMWVILTKNWRARMHLMNMFRMAIAKFGDDKKDKKLEMEKKFYDAKENTKDLYLYFKQIQADLPPLKELNEKHPKIFHHYWIDGKRAMLTRYWCDTVSHTNDEWWEYLEFSPESGHGFRMSKKTFDSLLADGELLVEKPVNKKKRSAPYGGSDSSKKQKK